VCAAFFSRKCTSVPVGQRSIFGVVSRPLARVVLEKRFPQWTYVDSGADISLIPLSVGKLIGLRRTKRDMPERILGVGRSSVPIRMSAFE